MLKVKINNFISEHLEVLIYIIFVIIIICLLYVFNYSNINKLTIEVKDKYVKNNGNSDKYIVIDSNNNSYEITDLFFIWKFNSTDIYSLLEVGKTYNITTSGIRFRLISKYPNINKVEEIK